MVTSDEHFTFAIEPQFTSADNFVAGLAQVKTSSGSRVGYINHQGKFVIQPQFDLADNFQDRLAAVKIKERWGYIQPDGKVVISPQFDRAGD